jgi:hypothetical protein
VNLGAAQAVLGRFRIGAIVIAQADPWSASLRAVVQQAQSAGLRVEPANGPFDLDGVRLSMASDGRSWLIQAGRAILGVVVSFVRCVPRAWSRLWDNVDRRVAVGRGVRRWPPKNRPPRRTPTSPSRMCGAAPYRSRPSS